MDSSKKRELDYSIFKKLSMTDLNTARTDLKLITNKHIEYFRKVPIFTHVKYRHFGRNADIRPKLEHCIMILLDIHSKFHAFCTKYYFLVITKSMYDFTSLYIVI